MLSLRYVMGELFVELIKELPEVDRYALFERASIKEFDGGLSAFNAELQTLEEYENSKAQRK